MNPLTSLYRIATATRNNLYDRGILKSHKLSRPVISVGNTAVGGSGKTPFVIMLGELLKQHRVPFDVLSRGYGRKTCGKSSSTSSKSKQRGIEGQGDAV